jgi:hypothetical protein
MKEHLFPVIWRSIHILAKGNLQFHWQNLGTVIQRPDGQSYRIFRQGIFKLQPDRPLHAGAVFCVWFHAKTPPAVTVATSWLTLLFIAGMRGLRSKIWLYNAESGEFGGIYEWDTLEQAQEYGRSFAMRLSALRSIPGMFQIEAFPITDPRAAMHQTVRIEAGDHFAGPRSSRVSGGSPGVV